MPGPAWMEKAIVIVEMKKNESQNQNCYLEYVEF